MPLPTLAAALLFSLAHTPVSPLPSPGPLNALSAEEKKAGYVLLFDGKTHTGWRRVYETAFPSQGWEVADGELRHVKAAGGESNAGGDIVTEKPYRSFVLSLEWKISPGGNSGIKYFVTEQPPRTPGSALGLEYQILDDTLHPDAKLGFNGNRTAASLYDLIPAAKSKPIHPVGQWNHAVLIVVGNHVEHWLNGRKVLEYERGSDAFRQLVAGSKYKDKPGFGEWPEGRILLQDHGDAVAFRSIKIRELGITN